jgi:hypothetical protein
VPAYPLEEGFHWMAWQSTGALTVGQWCADLRMWVVSYLGGFTQPAEMAHLNYLGRIPEPLFTRTREPPVTAGNPRATNRTRTDRREPASLASDIMGVR